MADSYLNRLVSSFESRSGRTAMRIVGDDAHVYTFGESLRMIRSVAYRIGQENVEFGDRVVVMGENHPSWAIAYLATLYRGAVCVPIDPHGEIETVTNFFDNSEAKLAFIDSAQTDRFKQIEEKLGRHIPAVVWETNGDKTPIGSNGFQPFAEWASTDIPAGFDKELPKAAGDDIALLIYTSGTTGTPKGVPLTHANIVAELDGINHILELSDKERILSLLPLFHAYLQIVNLWVATTYGCEVGYLKELSPAELGNAMKEFKPTILTTVPRLWYLFHKKIFDAVEERSAPVRGLFRGMLATNGALRDTTGLNLGPRMFGKVHESFGGELRMAISAGSRFDEDVARDFHKLGFTILQGYGLTETSGAATATYVEDNRVGSVGKPLAGAEVMIDSPDAEGVGEVLIRGAMVFSGYYKNPEVTREVFTEDGWFRSGDLGKFDRDGHLYIVGRAKDVIVLPSGKNVHPEDLEVHYLKTPYVEEMAVIGVRDEAEARSGAEKLVAVVVPDFEYLEQVNIANSREIIRYTLDDLGRELPEYQRVRDYIIRSEPLPRTATRKIKRFELKKQIESGTLDGTFNEKKVWTFSAVDREFQAMPAAVAVTAAVLKNAKEAPEIHPDMNLELDLGLDSLARAETFAALEQAFGKEITAEQAASALTIRRVTELFAGANGRLESGDVPVTADLDWSKIIRGAGNNLPELKSILRRSVLFAVFAFCVFRCFYLFCRVFMRLEVTGRDRLISMADMAADSKSSFLICPNHQSYIDAFVICSTYPFRVFRNIFHVGTSGIFKGRIMEFVAKMLFVVPVDPDTQLMRAMKAGAMGLRAGKILNIYPEGERSYDGRLHEFKKGAAILATELEMPILPVALDGAQNVWPRGTWRIRPAKVKVSFGEPIVPAEIDARSRTGAYAALTARLKGEIEGMIDEFRA
ncbi:MAG TPA: AMP-binding protein [Pyrinomonadaceae bacterium]|nr:AMP-binding protein [Pyrinomonadaceae bacterium]HMP65986.1 AMP-binding protein [Pyrinomonadaceae bacterium]